MIKGLIAATATALLTVAALTAADHVDAHTPIVSDGCHGLEIELLYYEHRDPVAGAVTVWFSL